MGMMKIEAERQEGHLTVLLVGCLCELFRRAVLVTGDVRTAGASGGRQRWIF